MLVAGIANTFLATGTSPPDLSCQKPSRDWPQVILGFCSMYCSTNCWQDTPSSILSLSIPSSSTQLEKKLWTSVLLSQCHLQIVCEIVSENVQWVLLCWSYSPSSSSPSLCLLALWTWVLPGCWWPPYTPGCWGFSLGKLRSVRYDSHVTIASQWL